VKGRREERRRRKSRGWVVGGSVCVMELSCDVLFIGLRRVEEGRAGGFQG